MPPPISTPHTRTPSYKAVYCYSPYLLSPLPLPSPPPLSPLTSSPHPLNPHHLNPLPQVNITVGGTVSPYDSIGLAYTFVLNTYELNLVKSGGQGTGLMGKATTGTYLTMPYGVTRALDKGAIVPYLKSVKIAKTAARVVTTLALDVTPPNLLSFDLGNLNQL